MIKEGRGHHPHSLRDPNPIADFIERSVKESKIEPPDFVGNKFRKNSYYSTASSYQNFPGEGTYITCRPLFNECYDRYEIELPNVEAFTTVIVPKVAAPGNPWVFRADFVGRDEWSTRHCSPRGFTSSPAQFPITEMGLTWINGTQFTNTLRITDFPRSP